MRGLFALGLVLPMLLTGLARRHVVEGRSMLPSFAPGGRVVAERLTYLMRRPRVRDAIVLRQPGGGGRLDLKRIAAMPAARAIEHGDSPHLAPDEVFVTGDNLEESTDSRQLGPIKRRDIVGRVWFKY